MKELDIKWLQEYAEQEKKYKWGKQIKVLLKDYEDSQLEIEELKSRNQGKTEALEEWINGERVSIHCVHKNKIKEKIEEVDIQLQKLKDGLTGRKTNFVNKNMLFAQKEVLQSLLEKE